MAIRFGSCLLLTAVMGFVSAAEPEDHRSHVLVPAMGGDVDPQKLFDKRLQLAKGLEELRKSNPRLLTPEKLRKLAKGIDLNDPKLRGRLEALLRQQHPNIKLTPEQIEALERLVKEAFPETGKSPLGEPRPGTEPNPMGPSREPDEKSGPNPAGKSAEPVSPEERERQAEAQAEASRQLVQFAHGLERFAGNLNESPTLKRTFQDLGAMALRHAGERPDGGPSSLNAQLAQFNRLGSQGNNWFAKNWPHLRAMDLPRLSAPRLPSLSMPWRRPALPGMPSSVGAVGANSDLWKVVLTAVLMAALVVALGKLLGRLAGRRKGPNADDWQLGPWPISPAAVRTRAELIRTFEYLSLLRLGRQARAWNHRAIARSLAGEQSPEHQTAAKLADLYEQARYAPADEPLSEETLETYRRDLCVLAGVAAS